MLMIPEGWKYIPKHRWFHMPPDDDGTPADICEACSDLGAGRWVPVSFCPEAMADMKRRTNDGWF